MKKLKVGVIGVGYLGKFHAEKYAAMDDVELAGVSDVNIKQAEEVASRLETRAYDDYLQLLPLVDAVSIVVPTVLHHKVAMDCLEHNLDILIEKPMVSTLEQADELIKLAEEKDLLLQVGHLERFNPAVLAMEPYVDSPLFVESHRIHTFKNRGVDVDVVLDLMIHDIDIISSLVKSPVKSLHAVGVPLVTETTDIANVRIIYESGCTANITVSRVSKDNMRRLRIFQPWTYISVDYAKKEAMVCHQHRKLGDDEQPKEEILHFCLLEQDALMTELENFVSNVREHEIPKVSGKEGRQALSIAMQVIDQINQNLERHQKLLK
jgi:predicted dehydrogenase